MFHGRALLLRTAVLAAILPAGIATAQQSLHEQPIGTTVERSFGLAGKLVPLPEGKFKLVHAGVRTGQLLPGARSRTSPGDLAEVVLYKSDGPTLDAVVHASANLGRNSRWSVEPCKDKEFLHRLDRAQTFDWVADCFTLNHQLGLMTNPGGIWVGVYDRLRQDGVGVPLPLVLVARFTRMYHEDYLAATFYINPAFYGYAADRGPNSATSPWHRSRLDKDPEKSAFVQSVTAWGTNMLPLVGEGFEGKSLRSTSPPMDFPRARGKAPDQ